jgi:uncharacterized membrane protein
MSLFMLYTIIIFLFCVIYNLNIGNKKNCYLQFYVIYNVLFTIPNGRGRPCVWHV